MRGTGVCKGWGTSLRAGKWALSLFVVFTIFAPSFSNGDMLDTVTARTAGAVSSYTITVTQSSYGTISPTGAVKIKYNKSRTFSIKPSAGYQIGSVVVDGTAIDLSSDANFRMSGRNGIYSFKMVQSDHTIAATFEEISYAGEYSGTFSGKDQGTWSVTIDSSGNISGTLENSDGEFEISGTVAITGRMTATVGSTTNGAKFTGTISSSGTVKGTWKNTYYKQSGKFSGKKVSDSTGGTVKTPVNGACGSSNSGTFSSAPSADLCATGTASTVSGSGPWTWNCVGSNGGTTASCSAGLTTSGTMIDKTDTVAYAKAMIPGAWLYYGFSCAAAPDPRIEASYFICPGGGIKGVEKSYLNSKLYEYLATGTWTVAETPDLTTYASIILNYQTAINIGGVKDEGPGGLGSAAGYMMYNADKDLIVYYYNKCWFAMKRAVDDSQQDATDVGDGYCGTSATGLNGGQCGADADCGRCWYCENKTCRYGGEGPTGICYRGWQP